MSKIIRPVAMVTGASSGIGLAVALRLARAGYRLALCGRSSDKLSLAVDRVLKLAPNLPVFARSFDITDDAAVRAFVGEATLILGAPALLVHCAGGNPNRAPIAESSPAMWDAQFALNCRATASVAAACHPHFKKEPGARAVIVVSSMALFSSPGNGAYAASKAAQKSLCDTLRKEWREAGIGVTAVYPGGVDTDFRPQSRPEYMRPETVAEAIFSALTLPADATVHELVLRPSCETNYL